MSAASSMDPLSKLKISGCNYLEDKDCGQKVFHVTTPHALTQAAGYLKYIFGKNQQSVFFRGQAKIYDSLSPSLVRGIRNQKSQSQRITALRAACGEITKNNKIFDGVPFEAQEALLQHYGLKTSWIDLVDNIWVSLWFACHKAHAVGPLMKFLHFEQRDPYSDQNPFAYILLIATDNKLSEPFVPGLCVGDYTELVDLRIAAPSIFLRPHAQHGVLFRMRGDNVRRPTDYAPQVRGTIRIDLRNAIAWIGAGKLTGTHTIFPPAFYDHGYAMLLDCGFVGNEIVGSIHHIGT